MSKSNFEKLTLAVAKKLWQGKQRGVIDEGLTKATAKELSKAITIDNSLPTGAFSNGVVEKMQKNIFHFSGAKSFNQLQEMSALLTDKNGKKKTFESFKTDILAIDKTYNKTYLRAEYNHALKCSQMMNQWAKIQSQKEIFPYLQYRAVLDSRTRAQHRSLDGAIRAVDDEFWNWFYPPNGFGCRCGIRQVESEPNKIGGSVSNDEVPPMFRNNVGKDGIIFSEKHPYFSSVPDTLKKAVIVASISLWAADKPIFENEWIEYAEDKKTKAKLLVHIRDDPQDRPTNIERGKIFIKNGISLKIRERSYVDGVKNPEVEFMDGKISDFKQPEKNTTRSLQSQFETASSQKCQYVILDLRERNFTTDDINKVFRNCLVGKLYKYIEAAYIITKDEKVIFITQQEVRDYSYLKKLREL